MQVIAKTAHEYASVQRKEGDEYECEDKDVPVVIALGWAIPREHYSSMPGNTRRMAKDKFKRILN